MSKALRLRFRLRSGPSPRSTLTRPLHTMTPRESVAAAARHIEEPVASLEKGGSWAALDAIHERRAKAGRLVAGVAAASDSDMFKGPVRGISS
jgi:aromatic amino acid aminotransferase I